MKSKLNPDAFIADKKSQKIQHFFLTDILKIKPLTKVCDQELSYLEKLHWAVFPFHLCFSVFLCFGLFILAFAPFQNEG